MEKTDLLKKYHDIVIEKLKNIMTDSVKYAELVEVLKQVKRNFEDKNDLSQSKDTLYRLYNLELLIEIKKYLWNDLFLEFLKDVKLDFNN